MKRGPPWPRAPAAPRDQDHPARFLPGSPPRRPAWQETRDPERGNGGAHDRTKLIRFEPLVHS